MIEISQNLENIIKNKSGIPLFAIKIYPTNFAHPSKGFLGMYFDIYEFQDRKPPWDELPIDPNERAELRYHRLDDLITIGQLGGRYGSGWLLREHYENQLRFFFGDSPPLGIVPEQLNDRRTWMALWTGLFYVRESGIHEFGFVSTGLAQIKVSGLTLIGSSPNEIWGSQVVGNLEAGQFLPISVMFARTSEDEQKQRKDERFTALWRREDGPWKVLDCSSVISGLDFQNLIGEPIKAITVDPENNLQENMRFDIEVQGFGPFVIIINDKEFPATSSGTTALYKLENVGLWIKWGILQNGARGVIYGPRFLESLVSPDGIPHVERLSESRSEESASQYSFSVFLTKEPFLKNDINDRNCYSYDLNSESYGILRKNRLVDIYQGYETSDSTGLIHRFRGFIDKINIEHSRETEELRVTCRDIAKLLIDGRIEGLPNENSYDTFGLFPSNAHITKADGNLRPLTYDAWKVVDAVRDLGYNAGLTSEQLFAKDNQGNYLIEDLDDYLDSTYLYPREIKSTLQGEELSADFIWQFGFGEEIWNILTKIGQHYGRQLYISLDGNLMLRLPNNPKIVHNFSIQGEIDEIKTTGVPKPDLRALNGFYYEVESGIYNIDIDFEGIGISLIMVRPKQDDPVSISIKIDDILVDGINIIDPNTNELGHSEYLNLLENGRFPLRIKDLSEDWWYKKGIHPRYNRNPTIIKITENLTYGKHKASIQAVIEDNKQTAILEAVLIYKRNVTHPVFAFNVHENLIRLSSDESDESMRNIVNVAGARLGAMEKIVMSRAIDIGSLKDPEAPNYLGYPRATTLILPTLRDQQRADYLAFHVLTKYRRSVRNPSIESVGLPFLELHDPITIQDLDFGFQLPIQIESRGQTALLNLERDPQDRFWITNISSEQSRSNYTMRIQATPFPPQAAYQFLKDPPKEEYPEEPCFTNIEITIDRIEIEAPSDSGTGTISSPTPRKHILTDLSKSWTIDRWVGYSVVVNNEETRFITTNTATELTISGSWDLALGSCNYEIKYSPRYNPYREDKSGLLVKIEYDQIFNAKFLDISAIVAESISYTEDAGAGVITKFLDDGWRLNTLRLGEGFMPHGHYILYWDGWWADENNGGSEGGGRYVPDNAKVAFKFHMIRESDGVVSELETNSDISSNVGILKYIEMDHSYLIFDGLNSANLNAPTNISPEIDYTIYDDSESQPDHTKSLEIIVNTNRLGNIYIQAEIFLLQFIYAPWTESWFPSDQQPWTVFEGLLPINVNKQISLKGTYRYYLSPSTQIRNNGAFKGLSKGSLVPFNYFDPANLAKIPTKQAAQVYSLWLFRIPTPGDIGYGPSGLIFSDKGLVRLNLIDSDPVYIQWKGNSHYFSTTVMKSIIEPKSETGIPQLTNVEIVKVYEVP